MAKTASVKITSTLAKSDDGNIQITFDIPFGLIKKEKEKVLTEMAKDVDVPGFRKGKAPLSQVEQKVNQNTLIEKTLSALLPKALGESIEQYKIKPVIYPKFELIKADDNSDWQIRAVTCELLVIELGDYKKEISGMAKAGNIWTPQKGKADEKKKELTPQEKEQEVIKLLLSTVKVNIPQVLIDEEVNNRLAGLLERIEKLGLTLEGYLSSLGKNVEALRNEYRQQAKNSISLELILEKIADQEKITIDDNMVDEAVNAASTDAQSREKLSTPEQKKIIASVLRRKEALDSLVALI